MSANIEDSKTHISRKWCSNNASKFNVK